MYCCLYAGISESEGTEVPCEFHKRSIIKTITKGIDESLFQTQSKVATSVESAISINTQFEYLEKLSSPFTAWLDEIVKTVDEVVSCSDDGDRDNVMYKPAFANDFIRLCKILPLWSGISCDLFEIDEVTSSSSNVECDFKNLKQALADKIPCSVDVFVEEHIELLRGATIEASQRQNYLKFVGNENIETGKPKDTETEVVGHQTEKSKDTEDNGTDIQKLKRVPIGTENSDQINKWNTWSEILENAASDNENSSGCRNGGEPGGAHRCIECDRAVHILPCCSISIGDEEGYGEKRLCNTCATSRTSPKASPIAAVTEMQYSESWDKTKKKKKSKYLTTAPNWTLNSNIQKNVKIGLLQNGNLNSTTYKVAGNVKVALTNTCNFDSICQVNYV